MARARPQLCAGPQASPQRQRIIAPSNCCNATSRRGRVSAARVAQATSVANAAPGSSARINVSPTRNALTPSRAHRRDVGRARIPLSVTTTRSEGTRGRRSSVVAQRDVERAQIAVVDADERRRKPQRAVELGGVVHFDQHRKRSVRAGAGFERREPRVVVRRDDQQDGVGAHRARLGDLILVDDEILAQHRQASTRRAPPRDARLRPGNRSRSVSTDRHAAPPRS